MILCVTLNPCLDRTLTVPHWVPGDSVRGTAIREVVGGKGNNVARTLARLGRLARPVMFIGGPVGSHCATLLREQDNLDALLVQTEAPTRIILTVHTDGTPEQSAFFDPDPPVLPKEAEALHQRVQECLREGEVEAITLSGSSPSPATHELFSELIALARGAKIPVFLDTYGPALDAIWGFWPDLIQLNRREAAMHLQKRSPTDADLRELLTRWAGRGVACAIVTDGPNPAIARIHGRAFRVHPPKIVSVNPIGSGDSLLAGLADAWLSGLPPEGFLRHGFACALANALVWDAGAINLEEVRRQFEAVEITLVSD